MSRETSLEALYDHALDALLASTGADRASVLLCDADGVFRFKAWRNLSAEYRARVEGHSPWTPQDAGASTILVPDVAADASLAVLRSVIRAEGIGACAFIPLVARTRLMGKFMVYYDAPHVFDPDEVAIAETIAREIVSSVERREAERELLAERSLFNGGPTVVFRWQSRPGWPVEYVSHNVTKVFGYSVDALVAGYPSYRELVHPDDVHRVADEMEVLLAQGRSTFEQEYRLRHADGRYRWVQDFTVVVRDEAGVVAHLHGYLNDITDRKALQDDHHRAQEQVRHRQKLESLGVLAGGIAHDFNNLLVAMLGNASLAKDTVPADSPVWPLLLDIETTARRAAELTRQLLAYSGKGTFRIEPIDLSLLVGEMAQLLGTVVSKKAALVRDLREGLPPVDADATQLRQVVMNVITNASDAIGEGSGTITLRTRRMQASTVFLREAQVGHDLAEGEYVVFEVSDTGVGMGADEVQRMFDPFYSTKAAGRGLGLAAVLGIVRGHRGALRVTSSPGTGTTVTLLLAPSQVAARITPTASDTLTQRTVLVVDDDEGALSVARRVLEGDGYTVLTASDGRRGLETYAEFRPEVDLVLMDLTMPVMDGFEAFREIRRLDPDAPVALMSGYPQQDIKEELSGAKPPAFLAKPYSARELRSVVAECVRRRTVTAG